MRAGPDVVIHSYAKTTIACVALVALFLRCALLSLRWLPQVLGVLAATFSLLVALGAALFAGAGVVVLARAGRAALGKRDLFLELNRSREPAAIKAAVAARPTRARRWLARRLLGHDLLVGDLVEVKTWAEIQATLDGQGCLQQLPFMPEMVNLCGQRAYIFRCAHRLFDYRKTRRMRHMKGAVLLVGAVCDGASHGGCEAACHTIWKADWLRRVASNNTSAMTSVLAPNSQALNCDTVLWCVTIGPRYTCQLTKLHDASQPIGAWRVDNFLRPLISGNVAPAAFAVGWLTHLFNELQQLRGGVDFPAFDVSEPNNTSTYEARFTAGDQVVVRLSAQIRATLNDQMLNRGLYFEPDMLKHCSQRYRVQAEVGRLIDIVSGEMLTMKTPAYLLHGVHFSGERQQFNAQCEPLYWRAVWLKHDVD